MGWSRQAELARRINQFVAQSYAIDCNLTRLKVTLAASVGPDQARNLVLPTEAGLKSCHAKRLKSSDLYPYSSHASERQPGTHEKDRFVPIQLFFL